MTVANVGALKSALEAMCAVLKQNNVPEEKIFDSKLVARELLVNALRHGGGSATFTFELRGGEIRICVKSENGFRPPQTSVCAEVVSERGRGLFLVDALAVRRDYSEESGICVTLLFER